jgi:hypothetical protein
MKWVNRFGDEIFILSALIYRKVVIFLNSRRRVACRCPDVCLNLVPRGARRDALALLLASIGRLPLFEPRGIFQTIRSNSKRFEIICYVSV